MNISMDTTELRRFKEKLENISTDELLKDVAAELAARLLRKVKKRTPLQKRDGKIYVQKKIKTYQGDTPLKGQPIRYKNGKAKTEVTHTGGELRRNWQVSKIRLFDKFCVVEVYNATEYAEYVEFGHRQTPGRYVPAIGKRLKKAWVPGKFMLTLSTKELENIKDRIIRQKVEAWLKEVF